MHLPTISLLLGAAQALLVPSPPGPYSVAVKHFELVDPSRIDPFAPEANTVRRFMASAYLPVHARHCCKPQVVPYMPNLTAEVFGQLGYSYMGIPQKMLGEFDMEFCDISTVKVESEDRKKERQFPVAVFSPGLRVSRLLYSSMARSLASLGYIIITLDHTYETLVVEFPDGSVAYESTSTDRFNETLGLQLLEVRTGDESSLISQLSNATLTDSVFAHFPGTFNPNKIAILGHSLGGATAAITTQRDPRVIGGLNLDGTVYGPVNSQGFSGKPFLLVAHGDKNVVPSWSEFYSNIGADKMELAVVDTQHESYMDVPLLLTQYQVSPDEQKNLVQFVGTLAARKIEKAVNEVVVGLLELLFNNDTKPLKNIHRNRDVQVIASEGI